MRKGGPGRGCGRCGCCRDPGRGEAGREECLGGLGKAGPCLSPLRSWERWGQFLSPPAAGLHRQVLFTTLGWFIGYQLVKRAEYVYAKVDREMFEYIRHHPVDFHSGKGTLCWYFKRDLSLP